MLRHCLLLLGVMAKLIMVTSSSQTAPPQTKPKLRRYLIARHGETNFNKEGREQGTLDTSVLTFDGISQAAALGVYIARRQAGEEKDGSAVGGAAAISAKAPAITRTWCSPMTRCRQTYAAISGCTSSYSRPLPNPTVRLDLREIDLSEWQGRLTREIMEQDSDNWNTFKKNPKMLRLDSGRFAPVLDCWERGLANWNAIRSDARAAGTEKSSSGSKVTDTQHDHPKEGEEDGECDVIFIMCHGGMGQCMLLQSLGIDVDMFRKSRDYAFDNCGCVEIEWADGEKCATRWRRVHPVATEWQSTSSSFVHRR